MTDHSSAPQSSFRFQMCCSILKRGWRGGDWSPKSSKISHFSTLWKLGEGWAECPSRFCVLEFWTRNQPLMYFWGGCSMVWEIRGPVKINHKIWYDRLLSGSLIRTFVTCMMLPTSHKVVLAQATLSAVYWKKRFDCESFQFSWRPIPCLACSDVKYSFTNHSPCSLYDCHSCIRDKIQHKF